MEDLKNESELLQRSPIKSTNKYKKKSLRKHPSESQIDKVNDEKCANEKSDKTTCLEKLILHHKELKTALQKSRQACTVYRVSNYFFPDAAKFSSKYGQYLEKADDCISEMDGILNELSQKLQNENSNPVDVPKEGATSTHHKEDTCYSMIQEKLKQADHPGSLTPPSSEIGSDEGILSMDGPNKKRKPEIEEEEYRIFKRKTRKCKDEKFASPQYDESLNDSVVILNDTKKMEPIDDDDNEDEAKKPDEYEVERIRDYVKKQGEYYYHVSWRGYKLEDDTFEPAENLSGCEEILIKFLSTRYKERLNAKTAEELKNLPIPHGEDMKELLFEAFARIILPISKQKMELVLKNWSPKTPLLKPKDVQNTIVKYLSIKEPASDRCKKLHSLVIEQVLMMQLQRDRLKQMADLRAWERKINGICSDPTPITVENFVDLTLPPEDFVYINDYLEGPGIHIPCDPMIGCQCKDCSSSKCCCPQQMASHFAYNKSGRLRVSLGTPIYECNKHCSCLNDCNNRVVQKGRKIALSIFRTDNGRGWGVKTLEFIKKFSFVTEYVGEVISSEEAERRGMEYDAQGCTYLFDLDYNKGDLNPYTVDAAKYGNVSHFINHSCDPNLVVFNVWINCLEPDLPKLALFAVEDIRKGEELTFDYNSGSTRQSLFSVISEDHADVLSSLGSKDVTPKKDGERFVSTEMRRTPKNLLLGTTECRCGAPNCRKYFF